MFKTSTLMLVAFIALLALPAARADSTAITLTSYGDFTNGAWTLGFEFSPVANIDVTTLGSFFPTGATDVHGVTLWNAAETVLATTTVTGNGTEGFDYKAITPVLLLAGQDYFVGANTLADAYADNGATWTTNAGLNYIGHAEVLCGGVTPCFPTNFSAGTGFGDFGANFQFAPAVPEPSSVFLLATVALGLGLRAKRKFLS